MIYLDNAATTKIDPAVLDAMMPYLTEMYGNAGSLYSLGRDARRAVDRAREQVAEFINADPDQVIFTSGGTESNNMVFAGLGDFLQDHGKTHVISAKNEHDSVRRSAAKICVKRGFDLTTLYTNESGVIDFGCLRDAIRPTTGLVSIMFMNNETGAINPVEEIGHACGEHGLWFHTDCVQAAGCIELDVQRIMCDFLSLSSHKIHGPKGTGALFVRDARELRPLIIGGHNQENGLRGGTENVAGIVGFGAACEIAKRDLEENQSHALRLKDGFYSTLCSELERYNLAHKLHLNADTLHLHGKTINLRLDDVDAETLLLMLDARGVCVSAGSACRSHESEPSQVLMAMGLSPEDARNSIRVSFSRMNTLNECEEAARIIAACARCLTQ